MSDEKPEEPTPVEKPKPKAKKKKPATLTALLGVVLPPSN